MDKVKLLVTLAVAAFGLLSQVCMLLGYTPPLPVDKLLHLTPEQITAGAAVLLAFLAPLHQLLADVWALVVGIVERRNAQANAAYAKLQADFADLVKQFAALQQAQAAAAQPVAAQASSSQAGRASVPVLLMSGFVVVLAIVVSGSLMSGCSSMPAPQSAPQTLAYTEAGVTAVRQQALVLLNAGQISVAQAQHVQDSADQAVAAIKAARGASLTGDVSTAQAQLALATQILTALQQVLLAPAAKP
jgi:hypothetical protein